MQYTITLESSAAYVTDAPTVQFVVNGSVLTFTQVSAQTGTSTDSYTYTVDSASIPSTVLFRFLDALPETGRAVTLHNVRINGQSVDPALLSALVLGNGQSSDLLLASLNFLFGATEPVIGDYGTADITGTAGDETLLGTTADNIVDALGGADVVHGKDGDDALFGGDGDDVMFGGTGNDMLNGNAGIDSLFGEDGDDLLFGSTGDDKLYGGAGLDVIYAGFDNDYISGGTGNDILYGEDGNDIIVGDAGDDTIYGGAGIDSILGAAGNDTIYGGDDGDLINGGADNDTLHGENGDDLIDGGAGNDTINGGAGADQLNGNAGNDTVNGDAGNDLIYASLGTDTINGGADTDTLSYAPATSGVTVNLYLATAQTTGGSGVHTISDIEILTGSGFADTLTGAATTQLISGGAGNDTITSGSVNTISATVSAILAANAGVIYDSTTGNFYRYVASNVVWNSANNSATTSSINGVSGHLVHITSAYENGMIDTLTAGNDAWTGTTDVTTEGTWLFSGGTLNGRQFWSGTSGGTVINGFYTNWDTGQPNDGSGGSDFGSLQDGGKWDDLKSTGSSKQTYVIEWEGSQLLTPTQNTTLAGGAGADNLYGAAGQDIFLFDPANAFLAADTIYNYNKAHFDKLDISDLLTGFIAGTSDPDAFARLTVSGANLLLQVDANGTTGGASFTTIATLNSTTGLNVEEMYVNNLLVMV